MSNEDSKENQENPEDLFAPVPVDLKVPEIALMCACLLPGAGHLYQGRTGKGILFMICILIIYFWGLGMGGGHVVYAKWNVEEKRLPYLCQVAVGLPAAPALFQAMLVNNGQPPISIFGNKLMAPPEINNNKNELRDWHRHYGYLYDMGTLYTMIAGLLNVMVIFDAYAGPVFILPEKEKKLKKAREAKESSKSKTEA